MTLVNCNHNSVSVICGVTWCVFALLLSYHKNGFDINCVKPWTFFCKFYVINKVQLRCSIFSIKTSSKLVPSAGELVWGNFLVFCASCFLAFLPFLREMSLDSVKFKARLLFCDCLSLLFIDTPLSVRSVSQRQSFHPHYRHDQSYLCAFEGSLGWLFWFFFFFFFFLSGFSFTDTDDSQASRGR